MKYYFVKKYSVSIHNYKVQNYLSSFVFVPIFKVLKNAYYTKNCFSSHESSKLNNLSDFR